MATQTRIVGAEALTMVRPEGSTAPSIYVFAGDPVPAGADSDDVARLLEEGYLEKIDVEVTDDDGEPGTKDEILAYVGEDKALAQEYLDAEKAATKPRVTLIAALEAIVAAE